MNENTDELFGIYNNIFGMVENKAEFLNQYKLEKFTDVFEFTVYYYLDMSKKNETTIPFNNYIKILSVLPLLKRKNGQIIKCEKCQFYANFSSPKSVNSSFQGVFMKNILKKHIRNFVENYRPYKILVTENDNQPDILQTFIDLHKKFSEECENTKFSTYSPIDNYYKKIRKIAFDKSLNSANIVSNNHIAKIKNYIKYMIKHISVISDYIDEYCLNNIIDTATKFISKNNISAIMPIFASLFYLRLNGYIDSATNVVKNMDKTKKRTISMQNVSNIFCISTMAIYNYLEKVLDFCK